MTDMRDDLLAIVRLLDERGLNTDVALFHLKGQWWAEAVEPSGAVMLGETAGKYRNRPWRTGPSSLDALDSAEAVRELLEVVRRDEPVEEYR